MYDGKRIAVVVPAYNESGFVVDVVETVPEFVDRIYAVDDASTDDTWAEIRDAAARVNETEANPQRATADGGTVETKRVVPIRHEQNQGVGAAITTGYRSATDDGMDVVAVMNGDGQMDPDILDRIIAPIVEGRADYAKGNRLRAREYRTSMSRWRFFGNSVLTFLTKIASGYWGMMDPQNGYTAISRSAIERIDLDASYDAYGFCNDILVRLNVHQLRIEDVEMPAVYGDENSHIRYRTFVPKLSLLLARRFLWRLQTRYLVTDFHPLVFLYAISGLGLVGGGLYGLWALTDTTSQLLHLGVAATELLVALTVLVLAMVLDMQHNRELEVRG